MARISEGQHNLILMLEESIENVFAVLTEVEQAPMPVVDRQRFAWSIALRAQVVEARNARRPKLPPAEQRNPFSSHFKKNIAKLIKVSPTCFTTLDVDQKFGIQIGALIGRKLDPDPVFVRGTEQEIGCPPKVDQFAGERNLRRRECPSQADLPEYQESLDDTALTGAVHTRKQSKTI